jgi:hypothetical protein
MHRQPRNDRPCNAHCGIDVWTAMLRAVFEKATVNVVKKYCLFGGITVKIGD